MKKFVSTRIREDGFTLIELLVVVIIIAILAAIAVPVYIGIQNNAKKSSIQSDVATTKLNVAAALTEDKTLASGTDSATVGTTVQNSGSPADEVVQVTINPTTNQYTVTGYSPKLSYAIQYSSATGQQEATDYSVIAAANSKVAFQGFEGTSDDNWAQYTDNSGGIVTNADARTGSYSYFGSATAGGYSSYTTNKLTVGTSYTATFYVKSRSAVFPASGYTFVNNKGTQDGYTSFTASATAWTKQTITFTAQATSATLVVNINSQSAYLDDLSLTAN